MNEDKKLMSLLKERIEDIDRLISEIASGNFDYRIGYSNQDDELDAIIAGINMLGEELKSSTVSRDYMDSIYKGVVDPLFVLDEDFNINSVNPSANEVLGYVNSELKGVPFFSLVADKENNILDLSTVSEKLTKDGFINNVELYLICKDGKIVPTSSSIANLVDNQKKKKGILVISKDISNLKQVEEELRKAKDHAEAANKAKSLFLANMSHEIRTPLNGIVGVTEILLAEATDSTQLDYLNIIRKSGKSLAYLINDILDLSRIESGKLSFERIEFDLIESIESNLHPFKFVAEQKGLTLGYFFDRTIPHKVIGDPTRLNQILTNLVSNAIKFTEEGSIEIMFRARSKDKKSFVLEGSVKDTGIGIPPEKVNLIFKSFTQADDSFTRKYGGSGLGLTIVEKLIKLMDGTISFHSPVYADKKNGTEFKFTVKLDIPAVTEPVKTVTKQAPEDLAFPHAIKVLLVDDNDVNLIVAEKVLISLGAKVYRALNGQEAVDKIFDEKFDIVLMDIQMPVLDGYEASRRIRAKGFKKPIMALSANVFSEHIQKCWDAGMNGHLQKPFTRAQLFEAVSKCLNEENVNTNISIDPHRR